MFEDRAGTLNITLNGEHRTVPAGQSLLELLAAVNLPPQAALVELNGCALPRAEWPGVMLANGDRLEILRVAAGG